MKKLLHSIRQSPPLFQLAVLSYFTILTIAYTYPLIFHMADSVADAIGDNVYFVWLFGWYPKALFTLKSNPFFNPWMNYPQGWNLATTDTIPALALLGLPASMAFGPIWAYNFTILATFVLTGWCMFLVVKKLTNSPLAGIMAGTIFAFSPFRYARYLVGHLCFLGMFWFPLLFLAVAEFLGRDRWQWRWLIAAMLLTLGIGMTSPYYLYMGLIISGVFILALIGFSHKTLPLKSSIFRGVTLMAAIGTAALVSMLPYLTAESQGSLANHSLDNAIRYSGSPLDFILPVNFYLGESLYDQVGRSLEHENSLYIGLVCLALAVLAWIKRRDLKLSPWIWAALVSSLVAGVLAMGINLQILDSPDLPVPRILRPILGSGPLQIRMPGYFLFLYLPFFAKMRVMLRFGVYTLTFMSLLAGLGCAWLFRKFPARRYWIAVILFVALVLDVYPGVHARFARVETRPVDLWLAAQPGSGAVAQFPFEQVVDQDQVYNTLIHGKPFIGGFFNANQPAQYIAIKPVMENFPDKDSVALLRELGIQYILVDSSSYPDFGDVQQRILDLGLVLQTVEDGQYVYTWP